MLFRESESRFAKNGNIRLHYVVAGVGRALLFLHGIPDFHNGWRRQICSLGAYYRVAAMDLRGFNCSDKPSGGHFYRVGELVGDVLEVIRDLGVYQITLVGHDWGAILAWWTAILYPGLVEGVVVLSAPHPLCYLAARDKDELQYPREYLEQVVRAKPGADFDPDLLSGWVSEPSARRELADALRRSDPEAIRNYYRANLTARRESLSRLPAVQARTLIMYGAEDKFIPPAYYNLSADHVAGECTIVAIPDAGHFIHQEAAERVTAELLQWLDRISLR
jgi:pimeloyl-ACP methyl ester carboxylesterase